MRKICIGKSKAMEWCLTGDLFDAKTAEKAGLISRAVPDDKLVDEVENIAQKISSLSLPVIILIKESLAFDVKNSPTNGLTCERKAFYETFASKDKFEGMQGFLEERTPKWSNE